MTTDRKQSSRQVRDLSGIWEFAFLGAVEPDALDIRTISYGDRMMVPGCFDATPAYAGKRGLAAYRMTVRVADTARHRLVLDGVHHWCRVFIAGLAIWQFCDIRTYDSQLRARGFNNKGVVDEYRRPKQAYETIKRLYGELDTAHAGRRQSLSMTIQKQKRVHPR